MNNNKINGHIQFLLLRIYFPEFITIKKKYIFIGFWKRNSVRKQNMECGTDFSFSYMFSPYVCLEHILTKHVVFNPLSESSSVMLTEIFLQQKEHLEQNIKMAVYCF